MAIDVGEIVATLRADTSQFVSGIQSATSSMDALHKETAATSKKIGSNFSDITKSFGSVKANAKEDAELLDQAGLSIVRTGGKITAFAAGLGALGLAASKEFGTYAEQVGIVANKTGFSADAVQEFDFVLNRMRLSLDDLSPGFKKLSDLVSTALGGDDKATKKFAELGIAVDDLKNKNPEQVFLALVDALGKIEGPFQRNAAAGEIFGKAAMKLSPIFMEGSKGIATLRDRANELGLVFSGKTLSSMQEVDDGFDDLMASLAGFSRTLASTFAGPLKDFVNWLTSSIGSFNKWWQSLSEGTKTVVLVMSAAFAVSGPIIATIGAFIFAVNAGLAPLMIGGAIVVGLIGAVTAIIVNWESIKAKGVAIWTGIRDAIVNTVKGIYDGIKLWMVDKFDAIVANIKGVAMKVLDVFKWLRHELVGGSEVPDMVEEIGDHMRMLDKNMTAPARVAAQGTWNVFRELAGKMGGISAQIATTTMSAWSSVSNTISGALANQILQGNDWKQTMTSIGTSVLTAFINLGIQVVAQKALQLASWTAINAGILAGEVTTASAVTGIWAATGGAVLGTFGAMATGIMGFFSVTIMPMLLKLGTMIVTFLSGIASSLTISIFGAPFAVPVWAAVGVMAAAVGALAAYGFGAFAEGGIVTKPMLGMVGEGGESEAIIPLSKLGQMTGGGASTIIVELDGRQIAKSIYDHMPSVMRVRGVSA